MRKPLVGSIDTWVRLFKERRTGGAVRRESFPLSRHSTRGQRSSRDEPFRMREEAEKKGHGLGGSFCVKKNHRTKGFKSDLPTVPLCNRERSRIQTSYGGPATLAKGFSRTRVAKSIVKKKQAS